MNPGLEFVPASLPQEQLWALLEKYPDRPLGNFPLALNLEGPLDPALFVHALNDVVKRHDILHTKFEFDMGRLRQVVVAPLHVPVPVVDLRLLAPGVREAQAFRLAQEDAARPFDTHRLPLMRAQLFILEQSRHILVLTLHRGIFDHESPAIFLRELAACYEARRTGNKPPLPTLARQYPDYARSAGDPPTESAQDWWRAKFASDPLALRLPADRTHSGTRSASGRTEKIELSAALCCSIRILAHREGTNAFTILLTAFQALLHRYTNLTDFVVGLGASDRPMSEMENLLGPCTRLVPCRSDLSGNPRFRVLLERVRQEMLETYAHTSGLSFDNLPGRYRNPALACPVQFIHERREADLVNWPRVRLQELELDTGACACELSLRLIESVGRWTVRAVYDAESFSPATIQQLLAHFNVLLQAAVSQPEARLAELPLLTSVERRRLLHEWNNTRVAYPRDTPVHELVVTQATIQPDAPAVACTGLHLTYRQLDEASNQLGRHLRAAGVRPGRLVGLYLDRSPQLAVAALGILKAGGAVCLFDPSFPPTSAQVESARLDLLLTLAARRQRFLSTGVRLLLLDTEAADIRREDAAVIIPIAGPDDFCWLAWSAGTGGNAKPVEFSHRAIVSMLYARRSLGGITASDVVFGAAPLHSINAATELLLSLVFGARLELATAEELAEPAALAVHLTSSEATFLQAPPSLCSALLSAGWSGGKSLRLHCSSEPLSRDLADRLLGSCKELWNTYGTTETVGACLATPAVRGLAPPSLGHPFGNAHIHLLDAELQPVPVGLPGEIYVGGDALASGYRHDLAGTLDQFPSDPFTRTPGARLFRTGDLACRLHNGEIEYLGRQDQRSPSRALPRPVVPARVAAGSRRPFPPTPAIIRRESAPSAHPLPSPASAFSPSTG